MKVQDVSSCRHVAIIMDGNGRWAEQKGLFRHEGHVAGFHAVSKAVRFALDSEEIEVLTLFALSIENNKFRPQEEIQALSHLLIEAITEQTPILHRRNVRLRFMGERSGLSVALCESLSQAENLTQHNTGLILVIAVNYSGRWDVLQATTRLFQENIKSGQSISSVTEEDLGAYISCADLPEPDLLIRTGGELRLSNFMLWQMAYTEFIFEALLWPDFNETIFEQALQTFKKRKRRFGAVSTQTSTQESESLC